MNRIVSTACGIAVSEAPALTLAASYGSEPAEKEALSYISEGFVLLSDVAPEVIQEIRYFSDNNFVGGRVDGYEEPCAILTKEAACALKKVSDVIRGSGYMIKVYDAYRPQRASEHFKRWSEDLKAVDTKPYFYPEIDKSMLFEMGYICVKSGHTRGSTVDVTLVDAETGNEIDMGGTFDYFGERSNPCYKGELTDEQLSNRRTLREVMLRHGFKPFPTEWWHFTLKDEPYPDTYFDFPVSERSVKTGKRFILPDIR